MIHVVNLPRADNAPSANPPDTRGRADRRGAFAIGTVAVGVRVFHAAVIDMPQLGNAYPIAILLGGALGLIPALLVRLARARRAEPDAEKAYTEAGGKIPMRIYAFLALCLIAYDASAALEALVTSASYAALGSQPHLFVLISTWVGLVALTVCGFRAASGAARVLSVFLALMLIVVLLTQLTDYKPRWLLPAFGWGVRTMLPCAWRLAGAFSILSLLPLAMERDADPKGATPLKLVAITAPLAALLAAWFAMMTPALPRAPEVRMLRLDALLSNGRSPLSLQFPLVLVWFGSLFTAAAFEIGLGARMLRALLPKLPDRLCALAVCALALILTLLTLSAQNVLAFCEMLYFPVAALPAAYFALANAARKRRAA